VVACEFDGGCHEPQILPSNDVVAQSESSEWPSKSGVQPRGRCARAADLPALVYVRFTDSFETQELNEARGAATGCADLAAHYPAMRVARAT
jgi:hypothetical protein